jgi:cell wall-associated NlpC family hydrolase
LATFETENAASPSNWLYFSVFFKPSLYRPEHTFSKKQIVLSGMNKICNLLILVAALLSTAACSSLRSGSGTSGRGTSDSILKYRERIVKDAQKQVGVGYLYAGKAPKTGFDCSGFTSYVLGQHGVDVSPSSATQATQGRKIALDRVLPGDLIFFGSEDKIQHVALVVKRDSEGIVCIHSTSSRGVIVENITKSTYWQPRILFARDVITGH